ncbi:aromatic amino acid DMT transporter YddG [Achromobacter seleniivolatilans]|uniref:Aromatic amino acid DMT transporter YddG n=1 Tax=Achromobacter seleniivolatilans TaxID=3047478 RepID=A0ABY9M5A4_9BURK|nr:aromatic amino acid DMT transporter YddG [Achromobacter sp. R39]WMD22130.1 aromatic amino acid DMT transporter YddG [Achromobacter sp. R39]
MSRTYANGCGLAAILLFGVVVAGIRGVAEHFGAGAGAALLYTASSLFLVLLSGLPKIRDCSVAYLVAASALFVGYEICFSLSIGYAQSRRQTLEIGTINYLWPCFTVLFAVLMNRERPGWLIVPGTVLALLGVGWVVGSESAFDLEKTLQNVSSNPTSYGLALIGAVLWALYCNVTRRYASGRNMVSFFFMLTAGALWMRFALSSEPLAIPGTQAVLTLALAGASMAGGYALWNVAILHGNISMLATASYFTPVLSTVFASWLLSTPLEWSFWQGVIMVTAGSLLGYLATKQKKVAQLAAT